MATSSFYSGTKALAEEAIADAGQSGGPVLAEGTFEALGVLRANRSQRSGGCQELLPVTVSPIASMFFKSVMVL